MKKHVRNVANRKLSTLLNLQAVCAISDIRPKHPHKWRLRSFLLHDSFQLCANTIPRHSYLLSERQKASAAFLPLLPTYRGRSIKSPFLRQFLRFLAMRIKRSSESREVASAATYVMAAAERTLRALASSSSSKRRRARMPSSARREALNSTGRVTSWNYVAS